MNSETLVRVVDNNSSIPDSDKNTPTWALFRDFMQDPDGSGALAETVVASDQLEMVVTLMWQSFELAYSFGSDD